MIGTLIGTAAQVGGSIYGAIKSSQANNRAQQMIQNQRDENKRWYEGKISGDYTQRPDAQNFLRKQRELLNEQYKRARALNAVAGGTDESLALQKAAANDAMGDTIADLASQSATYKESLEQQYRANDAALNQQQAQTEMNQANQIASAAGQMGSAVSGLMASDNTPKVEAPNPAAIINPVEVADGVLADVKKKEEEEINKIHA